MGRIKFKIIPNASKSEFVGEHAGAVKIKLSSPPVEGKANAELIKFLSKKLGISKASIEIISGETGRDKVLEITNFETRQILEKIKKPR